MRRIPTALLVAFILMVSMVTPVFATAEIEITRQPQNSVFPENASAYWTVEATGDDLVYDWFIVYKGVAYNTITSLSKAIRGRKALPATDTAETMSATDSLLAGLEAPLTGQKSTASFQTKQAA